eukprot:3460145-Prymnesium_polylepis.1
MPLRLPPHSPPDDPIPALVHALVAVVGGQSGHAPLLAAPPLARRDAGGRVRREGRSRGCARVVELGLERALGLQRVAAREGGVERRAAIVGRRRQHTHLRPCTRSRHTSRVCSARGVCVRHAC